MEDYRADITESENRIVQERKLETSNTRERMKEIR